MSVGQKLDIWISPNQVRIIEEERNRAQQQRDTTDRYIYYTVQKGDTIYGIATKFNCRSITELKEENNIVDENDLKPGKKLKIYLNK